MPKKADPTGFGLRLKELREAAGLSQQELADRIGFHKLSVAKIEQGIREPTWASVLALANALGVTSDAFAKEPTTVHEPKRGRPAKSNSEATARPHVGRKRPKE